MKNHMYGCNLRTVKILSVWFPSLLAAVRKRDRDFISSCSNKIRNFCKQFFVSKYRFCTFICVRQMNISHSNGKLLERLRHSKVRICKLLRKVCVGILEAH